MKTDKQIPASKHFRLAQLAEGVFAAIHTPGGAALSNAGIVDLGERTLIFDTFMSPQAAVDLHNAAEALTGRPVDMVIDSHWHYDHIWGNQVFSAGTRIISTEETRRLIIATRGHGAYDAFMENAEANLETNRRQFEVAEDERQRRQLALWVDYYQALVALKPILRVRPPNLTFNRRLAFHGTARSAELVDYAGGHTESDLALFLSREGISGRTPRLLVPGHGPVGKAESLLQMKKYVQTLEELAHKMVREGETEDMIEEMAIPGPYDDWLFASFFPGNMHYLYQRLLREQAGMRD
jgi:cyclase